MTNQIMMIVPYRSGGTWVFDDAAVGLQREPFVSGVPQMIDDLIADVPNAENGFRMLFSASPFPGHQRKLAWDRAESGGNWYYDEVTDSEGWLCPALFRYFTEAPDELYVRAEPITD